MVQDGFTVLIKSQAWLFLLPPAIATPQSWACVTAQGSKPEAYSELKGKTGKASNPLLP